MERNQILKITSSLFYPTRDHSALQEALRSGLNPDVSDEDGRTLLHYAAKSGFFEAVKLVAEHGATVDRSDRSGQTALMTAVCEHGWDPSSLQVGRSGGGVPVASLRAGDYDAIAQFLLESGADPNLPDSNGENSLTLLAARGYTTTTQLLLRYHANVHYRNRNMQTALLCAARNNNDLCAAILVLAGSEVDAQDSLGATPLLWAAFFGNDDLYWFLVDHGADEAHQDNSGKRASDLRLLGQQQSLGTKSSIFRSGRNDATKGSPRKLDVEAKKFWDPVLKAWNPVLGVGADDHGPSFSWLGTPPDNASKTITMAWKLAGYNPDKSLHFMRYYQGPLEDQRQMATLARRIFENTKCDPVELGFLAEFKLQDLRGQGAKYEVWLDFIEQIAQRGPPEAIRCLIFPLFDFRKPDQKELPLTINASEGSTLPRALMDQSRLDTFSRESLPLNSKPFHFACQGA